MTLSPTTNDPLIGKILAERYRITELVGSGRFSIVYKGQHLFMDRAVAMKTLQSNLVEDETIIKRFEKEAVALSKLRHPNIVSVYDCFVHTNGQPFLVMDFLDGHTLEELLTERGAIPPKLMRAIVFQASAGLAHAHASGVLHRDIKPDNIILLPREKTDERVRLLDFGFALLQGDLERLTLSGTLCGSPAYISPERWKGKELDARSDIYSLAVVLFQGLTGQLPFKAGSLEELRNMHVSQDPPLLGALVSSLRDDQTAQQIVSKAMAKDPEERYQTMKDFHNAIKLWAPNSDDAEIAQWAKNAAPKPSPKMVPPGQPTMAQPISLQPMQPQPMVQPPPQPGSQAGLQQAQEAMPPQGAAPQGQQRPALGGAGQNAFAPPAGAQSPAPDTSFDDAATLPNKQTGLTFDEIETLQHKSVRPAFDDAATLPTGQTAQEAPADAQQEAQSFIEYPNSANPGPDQPHESPMSKDLDDHPLSPESIARIAKPNPRASLTKQDAAYIKAIAQTLGDSLGDQAKAIEITPALEEDLHMAPRDETSRLNFSAMPPPVVQSTVPEPGPKIVPVVDRRAKRPLEEARMGDEGPEDTSLASADLNQGLLLGPKPPPPGAFLPPQPPKPPAASTTPSPASSPAASTAPSQSTAPAGGAQPVPSDWTVKQEVAPWVTSPDEFKPKAGSDNAAPGQAVDGWSGSQAAALASMPLDSESPATGQPGTPIPPDSPSPLGAPSPFAAPSPLGAHSPFGAPGTPSAQSADNAQGAGDAQGAGNAPSMPDELAANSPAGLNSASPAGLPTPPGAQPGAQQGPPGAPASFGASPQFGALAQLGGPPQPNSPSASGAPQSPGSLSSGSSASSRISPVLPGSPEVSNAPGQGSSAPGSASGSAPNTPAPVPWSSSPSSAPVDFGKMFGDSDKTIVTGASITAAKPPGAAVPPNAVPSGGTAIGSPTASAANLSISAGNGRSQPPKQEGKRKRLPTFVDRQMSGGESGDGQVAAKKGGMGMVVVGIAAAVFVFAGIGIATWMITNVNPSSSSSDQGTSQPNAGIPTKTTAPPAGSQTPAQTPTASSTDNSSGTATSAPGSSKSSNSSNSNGSNVSNGSNGSSASTGATSSTTSAGTTDSAGSENTASSSGAAPKPVKDKSADTTTKAPSIDTTAKGTTVDTTVKGADTAAKTNPPGNTMKSTDLSSKATPKSTPAAVEEQPKEKPSATGWFGMPTFNQETRPKPQTTKPAVEPAPPVTAIEETPHAAPPKPRKKKPKKPKKAPIAHNAGSGASRGGDYIEVEVTPGRRAYRSY